MILTMKMNYSFAQLLREGMNIYTYSSMPKFMQIFIL